MHTAAIGIVRSVRRYRWTVCALGFFVTVIGYMHRLIPGVPGGGRSVNAARKVLRRTRHIGHRLAPTMPPRSPMENQRAPDPVDSRTIRHGSMVTCSTSSLPESASISFCIAISPIISLCVSTLVSVGAEISP